MSQITVGQKGITPGTYVETLTGNTGGAVSPNGSGNINVKGDGTTINVVGTPLSNTLTISAAGGLATTYTAVSGTASPSSGNINFLGGTNITSVAAGSTVSYGLTGQVAIANGGTNASSFTNNNGVVYFDGTGLVDTAVGTAGQVLTSQGAGNPPHFATSSSGSITITGDSGGALSGSAFTFTGGSTGLTFSGAGTTETLEGTLIVSNGGTGDASFTAYAPVCGGTTTTGALQSASTGISNPGYVLTSTGSSTLPTWQAVSGGSGIVTIDGDTGVPVTGTTVQITTNVVSQTCGSSVLFNGASTTNLQLQVTDLSDNTIMGLGSGNATLSNTNNTGFGAGVLVGLTNGAENSAFGSYALNAMQDGIYNTAVGCNALTTLIGGYGNVGIGYNAGPDLSTGSYNIIIGNNAGSNYTSTESSNIVLSHPGGGGESNTLRIGAGTGGGVGQLNAAYISGIYSIVTENPVFVTIDSVTEQLGFSTGPTAIGTINGDAGVSVSSATINIDAGNATLVCGSSVKFNGLSSTELQLNVSDVNSNTIIGSSAGNTAITLSGGSYNSAFGSGSLASITTATYNTAIGYSAGNGYTANESSNILINNPGTVGESNVLRIGAGSGAGAQQLSAAYISGINGVSVSNQLMVVIDNSTEQLGTATIPSGFTWNNVTGTSAAMAVNNGYIANNAGLVTLTLPATAAVGSVIAVAGSGAGGWKIAQNSGQTIHFGNVNTTTGSGGSLASSLRYDSVSVVCNVANTDFVVTSSIGNITYV